jgi:hypothetical protein
VLHSNFRLPCANLKAEELEEKSVDQVHCAAPDMKRAIDFRSCVRVCLCLAGSFLTLVGCGGGGSSSQPPPPPPSPPPQVTSVVVTPENSTGTAIEVGTSQTFTAQVKGTGSFNPAVTWSVNGVNGGNSSLGTIVGGQYTAPAVLPNPSALDITATSVQDTSVFGTVAVTVWAPSVVTSVAPSAASAGEQVTITVQNLQGPTEVTFSGANGTSVSMPVQQVSNNQVTATVPFGTASGPISMTFMPFVGVSETTNTIAFTRLPNLRAHASNKDLSSGETLQLDWRLLGASTTNTVQWTADSGSISAQGLFQAPIVTSESYSRITGCLQNTNSCDTVLLRILPFRIEPPSPLVNVGGTIQLNGLQGGSLLAPAWSVLAGGGTVTPGGLFTAPTIAAQSGGVPIAATENSTTEQTSVAVSGAFAGEVNRVFDYADFTTFTPKEATYAQSVAVSGNTAYALTIGTPFQLIPAYEALDVYDISNPDQPVWIDSVESATNYPANLFVSGNTLFSIDSNYLVVYSLTTQVPTVTEIVPIAEPSRWAQSNGVLYVLPYLIPGEIYPTNPIDLYDVSTGTLVHNHYELPNPANGNLGQLWGISGNGNIVYVSGFENINNTLTFTIATYDISQSPPSLLSTVVSTSSTEYDLRVVGNLLFADSQVYDISNVTPVYITTLPVPLEAVWGVQGNNVLITGGSVLDGPGGYAVVDISSPSSPVVHANVADLQSRDIFNPGTATWATNGRFYVADGTGGFAVYNALPTGGPTTVIMNPAFSYVYDQVIGQQILYQAAIQGQGGGLGCFDLSGGTANLVGTLMYPNATSFAVRVSGTNVFLGLADALKVIDAANPQSPAEIGTVAIPVNALEISGSTLFVGTSDGRLVVFDISTPASPKQIASLPMPAPSTIRLSGTLLLVAAGQSGLLIFDVSHPNTPAMLSQFSPTVSAPVWDVGSISTSAVLLAADNSGIVTVDISNPSNPRQLYQQPLPYTTPFPNHSSITGIEPAVSVASFNGLTYVGTADSLMFSFDTSVPAFPRLVALNILGAAQETVAAITPSTSTLYVAVQGVTVQLDNSVPENLIELYYPPAALSLASPITDGVERPTVNLKLQRRSHRLPLNASSPDRSGNVAR